MLDIDKIDYFSERSLIDDPYPYFEQLRARGPLVRLPHHNAMAVTGYPEAIKVYGDTVNFSSVNAFSGPLPPLPFTPQGDDIGEQIEQHRQVMPASAQIITFDGKTHSDSRSLLLRLFTPSRLRANEEFLRGLSDRLIDEFAGSGHVEIVRGYGSPFAGLVITDLLGVPEEDRAWFRDRFAGLPQVGEESSASRTDPLAFLGTRFVGYIAERRENPRNDVLSELATARLPDGSMPSIEQVVNVAIFLFAAGQDTTARLLGAALQVLAERPDFQDQLRRDPSLIPDFIEEALRFDGPVKTSNRLVRKSTSLAGVELKAGTSMTLLNGAINRDPRRFETPGEFRLGRPKAREHVAFGRGAHTCPGAPLARTEVRVSLERLLARLSDIRIDEEKHGPPGARRLHHEPTYILRGLQELHLTFTAAKGPRF